MSNDRKRRITNRTVNALAVETDTVFWDRRLAGFGVRAYPSGARVYIAQARGPRGTRRVTLGRHGVVHADKARRRAALAIARIVAGEDPVPQRTAAKAGAGPTVAEVAERYLREHTAVQCKPRTLEIRRTVIANHIVPAMGKVALAAVRPEHAIELHQRMAGIPAQANIAIATLSHIFRMAQVWGLVEDGENPCLSVTRYRSRKRERFLTQAEFARLGRVLEEAPATGGASPAAIAAIRLLTLTGCRRNEILTLRWEDVNLPGRETAAARCKDRPTGGAAGPGGREGPGGPALVGARRVGHSGPQARHSPAQAGQHVAPASGSSGSAGCALARPAPQCGVQGTGARGGVADDRQAAGPPADRKHGALRAPGALGGARGGRACHEQPRGGHSVAFRPRG